MDGLNQSNVDPRDLLAIQRTRLAVERTYMSFIRTAIAILAGAVGLPFLFDGGTIKVAGWILGAIALSVVVWGTVRFRVAKGRLDRQRKKLGG